MVRKDHMQRELQREWDELQEIEKHLIEERKAIVNEWICIEEAFAAYNAKQTLFEEKVQARFQFLPIDIIVTFNVGGQLFKSTVAVWTRDRFSILAQLCTKTPKLPQIHPNEHTFFLDRDFWIFQYIYDFLRDNTLPDDTYILHELYCEAAFYRVGLLRHAIEAKLNGEDISLLNSLIQKPTSMEKISQQAENICKAEVLVEEEKASALAAVSTEDQRRESDTIASKFQKLPDPHGFTS